MEPKVSGNSSQINDTSFLNSLTKNIKNVGDWAGRTVIAQKLEKSVSSLFTKYSNQTNKNSKEKTITLHQFVKFDEPNGSNFKSLTALRSKENLNKKQQKIEDKKDQAIKNYDTKKLTKLNTKLSKLNKKAIDTTVFTDKSEDVEELKNSISSVVEELKLAVLNKDITSKDALVFLKTLSKDAKKIDDLIQPNINNKKITLSGTLLNLIKDAQNNIKEQNVVKVDTLGLMPKTMNLLDPSLAGNNRMFKIGNGRYKLVIQQATIPKNKENLKSTVFESSDTKLGDMISTVPEGYKAPLPDPKIKSGNVKLPDMSNVRVKNTTEEPIEETYDLKDIPFKSKSNIQD